MALWARTSARVVARVDGAHRVQVRGTGLTLFGAQSVRAEWAGMSAPDTTTVGYDLSLNDDTQYQLSKIGFSQGDFADGIGVAALVGGTGTDQPSIRRAPPATRLPSSAMSMRPTATSVCSKSPSSGTTT